MEKKSVAHRRTARGRRHAEALLSRQNHQLNRGTSVTGPVNSLRSLLEILRSSLRNLHEFLRIPIHQRKPGTLHLNHQPVPPTECVTDVRQHKLNLLDLARSERLGLLEAVSKLAPKRLAPDQLLISAHPKGWRQQSQNARVQQS